MAAPIRKLFSVVRPLETIFLNQSVLSPQKNNYVHFMRKLNTGSVSNGSSRFKKGLAFVGCTAVAGVTLTTLYNRWSPYWFTLEAASSEASDSFRLMVKPNKQVRNFPTMHYFV